MRDRRRVAGVGLATGLMLVGCRGDDGGGASDGDGDSGAGGVLSVHANPRFQPVVEELVAAYNESTGDTLSVTVGDQIEATQAGRDDRSAVLPGPRVARVGGESEVVPVPDDQNFVIDVHYLPGEYAGGDDFGAFLKSEPAAQTLTTQGHLP